MKNDRFIMFDNLSTETLLGGKMSMAYYLILITLLDFKTDG